MRRDAHVISNLKAGQEYFVNVSASGDESNEDEGDDENELDKQMGDLGEGRTDTLDEQMWGSDGEDEEV